MLKEIKISVISPVYKAKEIIPNLIEQLHLTLNQITTNYEIILIDDGCPNNSWLSINSECQKDNRVKGIKLSKNFGQHYAISAGVNYVSGNWIVIMDCDLQDNPILIPELLSKAINNSSKIVFAKRIKRKDNFSKKISSVFFHRFLSYLTNIPFDSSVANFGVFHAEVINLYKKLQDRNRVFPIMVKSLGFKLDYLEVIHNERIDGKSSYSFLKRLNLAFDIILSFSNKPLMLMLKFGLIISILSLIIGIVTIFKYYSGIIKVTGYTSILVSIWFLCGMIIFMIGLSGLYIAKIFDAIKNRPLYIVDEKINFTEL